MSAPQLRIPECRIQSALLSLEQEVERKQRPLPASSHALLSSTTQEKSIQQLKFFDTDRRIGFIGSFSETFFFTSTESNKEVQ